MLINIHTFGTLSLIPHSKGYWQATKAFASIFECDDGFRTYIMMPNWITDKRSGSSLADCVIPKWLGNPIYQAIIGCHDLSYSGEVSKNVADELFYQGLLFCGYSKFRAGLAYQAVDKFGASGYYNTGDEMPKPYQNNREFEIFRHFATLKEASEFAKMQIIFA